MTYDLKDQNQLSQSASKTQWGSSLSYEKSYGATDITYSLYLGNNGSLDNHERSGLFYGASILSSTPLSEKLELVGRSYYWAASEAEGVRTNHRYATKETFNNYGNSHGSLYAGLNYYLMGHHSMILTGLEWETLHSNGHRDDMTTLWTSYRMFF